MDATDPLLRKFRKELSSGTVALALLAILGRSVEPLYGYQIAKRIVEAGHEGVPIKQGTLYSVLRSMEGDGLLSSQIEPSPSGPPRKYYRITEHGADALGEWNRTWSQTRDFIDATLEGTVG